MYLVLKDWTRLIGWRDQTLSMQTLQADTSCVHMQLIEGTKGKRHRLVSIVNNMQTAESLKMQSVMLGGAADPCAFMTEVGPFPYEAFRVQEVASPGRRLSRDLLPQLSLQQVSMWRVSP